MIHDVDASVRALLERDAVNGDVEVAFDAPTRDWAAKRTSPTIDVYLYDIREDLGRRRAEPIPVVSADGAVVGRRRPPRHYRLSYLVTAWTQRPEDEHRLLSAVLQAFLPHDSIPRDLLQGSLEAAEAKVYTSIGLPPSQERSIGEIWSAMGGELKPSLDLVVSAPFVVEEMRPAGPPVTEQPRFEIAAGDGQAESRSGGTAPEEADEVVAAGASETINAGKGDTGRKLTISTIGR